MVCERCGRETMSYTMSYFDTAEICLRCSSAEREHPDYEKAREAEAEAVRRGDYQFPGIGWTPPVQG